jgi:hypothetical protein
MDQRKNHCRFVHLQRHMSCFRDCAFIRLTPCALHLEPIASSQSLLGRTARRRALELASLHGSGSSIFPRSGEIAHGFRIPAGNRGSLP